MEKPPLINKIASNDIDESTISFLFSGMNLEIKLLLITTSQWEFEKMPILKIISLVRLKRPLVPEKRSGLGFTLAPQIGDYTCPKCHYRGHATDFQIKTASQDRKSRIGTAFLFFAGLILVMDSYFTTNLPGAPATLHGTIHGFGGLLFFTSAPVGILLVSRKISMSRFVVTLVSLIAGFVVLGAPINAGGLAERLILLLKFGKPEFSIT